MHPVRAAPGPAVGRVELGPIDEDQRFYLESRGVPPGTADRLIALGFLDEVLSGMLLPSIAPVLRSALAAKLAVAQAAEEVHV